MYIHVVYCLEFTTAYSSVGTDVRFLARRSVGEQRQETGEEEEAPRQGKARSEVCRRGMPGFYWNSGATLRSQRSATWPFPPTAFRACELPRPSGTWGRCRCSVYEDCHSGLRIARPRDAHPWRTSRYRAISGTNRIGAWSGM